MRESVSIICVDGDQSDWDLIRQGVSEVEFAKSTSLICVDDPSQSIALIQKISPDWIWFGAEIKEEIIAAMIEAARAQKRSVLLSAMSQNIDFKRVNTWLSHSVFSCLHKPLTSQMLAQTLREGHARIQSIREKEETQTRAVQAQRLSSANLLAGSVAHEINNANAFIKGNIELIRKCILLIKPLLTQTDTHAHGEQDKIGIVLRSLEPSIDAALRGAERIQKVVLGLLSMSRQTSARKALSLQYLVNTALAHTSSRHEKYIKNITLPDSLPDVLVNEQDTIQAIENILINASDALDQKRQTEPRVKGVIEIHVDEHAVKNSLMLLISDNAHGIEPAVLERIFEPFYTTKPLGQGLGLGLSVARSNLMRNGGDLVCTSHWGQGTTFQVKLPTH